MTEYFVAVISAILALLTIRRHIHRQRERDRAEIRRHLSRL